MITMFRALAVAVLLGGMPAAQAAPDERNGFTQIVHGDYAGAERIVNGERRMFPTDPDLLLNLATVYRRTGRTDEARALYQSVLARPDVDLDLPGERVASAHALALAALRQLTPRGFVPR
jgi:hypothetical protein